MSVDKLRLRHPYLFLITAFYVVFFSTGCLYAQAGHMRVPPVSSHSTPTGPAPLTPQPIVGSKIYLFAVGMNGPNTRPSSLLSGTGVTLDSAGNGYVTTDSNGNFDLTGLFAANCPSSSSQVYLLASGGRTNTKASNPSIRDIAAMPVTCSSLPSVSSVGIGPPTTAAAAYALAAFADSLDDGFSTSVSSSVALSNAFAYANSLASGYDGNAVQNTASTTFINTFSDILSECEDFGGSICTSLASYTTIPGQTAPTNEWRAALNMVLYPTTNVPQLYNLISTTPDYQPVLFSAPSTWQMSLPGAPVINSLSIYSGGEGESLTLTGMNFGGSSAVVVGGLIAPIQSTTSTSMSIAVPTGAKTGSVQVYSANQGSNPIPFSVLTKTNPGGQTVAIALSTSGSISTYGDLVTFTAMVTRSPGSTSPLAGMLTFSDNGTPLAAGSVPVTMPHIQTGSLAIGSHQITVNYSNDSNYPSTSSNTIAQTVTSPTGACPTGP